MATRSRKPALQVVEAEPEKQADTCRGKWSQCGGVNPSRSTTWHLCQECTDVRSASMKAH